MTNVLIVESHQLVAEGIARLLKEEADIKIVKTVNSIDGAISVAEKKHPKVILLGVGLSDGDGIDAIPRIRAAYPKCKIIILTRYAEAAVVHRALSKGISGFIVKTASGKELKEAIRVVVGNGSYFCKVSQALIGNEPEEPAPLTKREREILKLIVEGLSQKQVADRLCLGFETIHSYAKSIRKKMKCRNTASVVRKAIEQHLD